MYSNTLESNIIAETIARIINLNALQLTCVYLYILFASVYKVS